MSILEQVLAKRKIKTSAEIEKFLNPPKPQTFSPKDLGLKLGELKKATTRIQKAIDDNQPIFIHGDYDVDGICGTAVLWETIYFNLSYQNVHPFIPHRINHGYGLSVQSIDEINEQRKNLILHSDTPMYRSVENRKIVSAPTGKIAPALLIALDCGITALKEIDYANSLNFDVLVLDHHEPIAERSDLPSPRLGGARLRVEGRTFPNAFALLHSIKVCSTALAWFLSEQILRGRTCPAEGGVNGPPSAALLNRCDLDLVALATIADLEPLTGLNRSFAKYGLEELNHTERIGLQELIKIAGIENRKIGAYEVGWMLGPRLNAMGRLENALDSLRLLCTHDRGRAKELAQKLNEANYQRQEMTKKAVEQARQIVMRSHLLRNSAEGGPFTPPSGGAGATSQDNTSNQLLILTHSEWHEGIIGLIASKITEEFGRPTLAISQGKTISKGSARSIEGFNLVENLRLHQDLLINVGGHPMAAGLTIETAKIAEFTNRFQERSHPAVGGVRPFKKPYKIDLKISLSDINFELYQQLQQLEPFGPGNPQPLFQTNDLVINDLRLVGKENQHLKIKVGDEKTNLLDSIGFNLGFWAEKLNINDKINLVYYLAKDDFNGNQKVQLRIKTIEKS